MKISRGSFGWAGTVLCLMAAASSPAAAFGAIAVGEPKSIAKGGLAVGYSTKYATKEQAEAAALKECLTFQPAPADTRALCKIVKTFEKQCVGVAIDPKGGTPGFGWAVMATKAEADDAAMSGCRDTAGKSRVKFCQITVSKCDIEDSN
jgi:Domain of unknown function (DUF4189)